jgi:quercetin dioxygenase-like cupin family protein
MYRPVSTADLLGLRPNLTFMGDMMAGKIGILALTAAAFVAGLAVAQTVAQTGREPQFNNDEVKVWKSVILPNSPLPMHRHDHPRVIIALNGGTMKIAEDTGASETHEWQTGKAYWLPANPPGTHHQDINIGDKPIEVMVVELQKAK